MNYCVVGLQWGDEGKGKVVDILAENSDIVVRYGGGANAGHTVIVGDTRFALHLLPSGSVRPKLVSRPEFRQSWSGSSSLSLLASRVAGMQP